MSKYDSVPLKPVKATKQFICYNCNSNINPKEIYHMQKDEFLQTLSNKRFCAKCFEKEGQNLLSIKKLKKGQKSLF